MVRKIYLRIFVMTVVLMVVLLSCTKEFEFDKITTENLSGEWAFPLVKSVITIDDLISDSVSMVNSGDDGFITLVYRTDNLVSMDGSNRTNIPDQQKLANENFEIPTMPENVAAEVPITFDFTFDMVDENHRIDTMFLKSGNYSIGLKTNLNKNEAQITLTATNFIHNETGEPLQATFELDNPAGNELSVFSEIDLAYYHVQFDNELQNNVVYIEGLLEFVSDANPNLLSYYINLENSFTEVEYSEFFGFIGENEEPFSDTIGINIFNSTDLSSISFGPGSVRLNIDVYNALGIPIMLEINKFIAYNTINIQDSIELEIQPDIIEINYPELDHFNEYVRTEVNTDFVDINEMLEISPDMLFLSMIGNINHNASPETVNYFSDQSNLYMDASLELDLFAGISEFRISDTLDFDASSFENVNMMEFMINVTNGFPINASVQFQFVDEDFNVLLDLIEQGDDLIEAGSVGPPPDYKVIEPTNKRSFILIENEDVELVSRASKIIVNAVLSTDENQFVKFYSDYQMDLNLGAKVIYKY